MKIIDGEVRGSDVCFLGPVLLAFLRPEDTIDTVEEVGIVDGYDENGRYTGALLAGQRMFLVWTDADQAYIRVQGECTADLLRGNLLEWQAIASRHIGKSRA